MHVVQAIFIIVFLVIVGLGIFVFLKNPNDCINKRFCIFANVISLWIFLNFYVHLTTELDIITFRVRLVFSTAIFIPSTFFFFSSVFPDRKARPIDWYLYICFFALSVLLALSSPHIIQGVYIEKSSPKIRYGVLFNVFWLCFIICMSYSLYILYKKSKHLHGIKRLQVQYLYSGVALSVFLGAATNLVLPLLGIWQVEMFVPLVSIPIPIAVAYAIVKYNLMDISIIIRRTTIYLVLSITLYMVYFIVGLILSNILPISEYRNAIQTVVAISVMIVTFLSISESIRHLIDKVFFHTMYSHSKVLSCSAERFLPIHDLNELLHYGIKYLYDSIGIEKICILTKGEKTSKFHIGVAINFTNEEDLYLNNEDIIVTSLRKNKMVISRDQIDRFKQNEFERLLKNRLNYLDIESCIPVFQENDLFAILLLGKKVNKKPFSQEDTQMLVAFSGQLAMAARNASLYSILKEAKNYRDNILQSLKNGVIVVDNNDEVTFINNEAKSILGLNGTSDNKIIFERLGKNTYQSLKYNINHEEENQGIEIQIERGSEKIPCDVTMTTLQTEEGKALGMLIVLRDMTELKLLQIKKQHAERLAHLGNLAANIAHEIKNPLVAINTYFQLLPVKKNDEEFQNDFQKIALKEIQRINRIVEDMLNLATPARPAFCQIEPHYAIKDTINLLKDVASQKSVNITSALEEKTCLILADEDKLKQILINILQNSIDATSANGLIKVSTEVKNSLSEFRKKTKINPGSVFYSFTSSHENDFHKQYFVINISDNGIGIPVQRIHNIFEPFYTDKIKGSGLGLAVVYKIMEEHKGSIYVESEEGRGTHFLFAFPCQVS